MKGFKSRGTDKYLEYVACNELHLGQFSLKFLYVCMLSNKCSWYIYISLNSLLFLALGNGILFPYSGSDPYVTKIASKRMSFPIEIEWSVWMVSLGLLCVCLSGLNYIKHRLILVTYHHSYIKNSNSLIEQETSCRGHIGIFVL